MNKYFIIFIIFLLLCATISPSINSNKIENNDFDNESFDNAKNVMPYNIETSQMTPCDCLQQSNKNKNNTNSKNDILKNPSNENGIEQNDKTTVHSLHIRENVIMAETGKLTFTILMEVKSPKITDLYLDAFGLQNNISYYNDEIPEFTTRILEANDNGTITYYPYIDLVREPFLNAIAEEQKFLFGFQVTNFNEYTIEYQSSQNLRISLGGQAIPYIEKNQKLGSKPSYLFSSPPTASTNEFLYSQLDISRAMLFSFAGINHFEKQWELTLEFPHDFIIKKADCRNGHFELGDESYIETTLNQQTRNSLSINEKWIITEYTSNIRLTHLPDLFKIQISPSTDYIFYFELTNRNFNHEDFRNTRWSWSFDWEIFNFTGTHPLGDYSIVIDLHLNLSGGLHVDVWDHRIYASFGIDASLEVTATIHGEWTWEKTIDLPFFRNTIYDWRGSQPLAVVVLVEPYAGITITVEGDVYIYINPAAGFDLKAGGDVDFQFWWPPVKFKPIFEFLPYCTFETSIDLEVGASIRPYLGFAVSLLVYGIIGPRISPELYFELSLGYSIGNGFYWHGVLGFDLLVGIQFTPWLHWNWPDPLIDIHLLEVDSEDDPESYNPPDEDPPITNLHVIPYVNNWGGGLSNFWFNATDPGASASGINKTMFNAPALQGYNNWQEFDHNATYNLYTNLPEYTINYYSIDNNSNVEDPQSETIHTEFIKPNSTLTVADRNQYDTVQANKTKISLTAQDANTGASIWFRVWHADFGWSDWMNDCKKHSLWISPCPDQLQKQYDRQTDNISFYFSKFILGRCVLEWRAMDGVWNFQDIQSKTFWNTLPPPQIEQFIMCDWAGPECGQHGPPKTQFQYSDPCYAYIDLNNTQPADIISWMWKNEGSIRYTEINAIADNCEWCKWTPDLAGNWSVDVYRNFEYLGTGPTFSILGGPEADLTYCILCDWAGPGCGQHGPPKTEFDFGQEIYCYIELENYNIGDTITWRWIQNGNVLYDFQTTLNQPCGWSSWTPTQSGIWSVDIYYKSVKIGTSPIFFVNEPGQPQGAIIDFIIDPNPVYPGEDITAQVIGKNIGEMSGDFFFGLETPQHGTSWSNITTLAPGTSATFIETFESITTAMNCTATMWFHDGYTSILHDSQNISITLASLNITSQINYSQCEFFSTDFYPNDSGRTIAWVTIMNTGNDTGSIYLNLYENPTANNETLLSTQTKTVNPGENSTFQVWINIAERPSNNWSLGIKTWGETQPEPLWTETNMTYQWNLIITEPYTPIVTTNKTTRILESSATLHGYINDDGGAPCTTGFLYGITYPLTKNNAINISISGTRRTGDVFRRYIFNLSPDQIYYYKSWIQNQFGFFSYGTTKSFSTLPPDLTIPTVITNTTTFLNNTVATFHGYVFTDGGEQSHCGFWYGTNYPLNESNSINVTCPGTYETGQEFHSNITTITPGINYYACGWSNNSKGYHISNHTFFIHKFENYSYQFTEANMGDTIPYAHTITFPISIWSCNNSIGTNDSVENFLQTGGIWSHTRYIFTYNSTDSKWLSWHRWRYDLGLNNSLTNLNVGSIYYFYLNLSNLTINLTFNYDLNNPIWYEVSFPASIWAYNSSIKNNDSCENFCQQGSIWDDIEWIHHPDSWTFWQKGGQTNDLTHLQYDETYYFKMLNLTILTFDFDINCYDIFRINTPPNTPYNPIPANNSIDININTNISWICTDPDPDDTLTYDVYFGTTNPPSLLAQNITTPSYNPGPLNYSTTYYWQIIAWDEYNTQSIGPIWTFETQEETIQISINLYTGWNLITIPFFNGWWASTLAENITGCSIVSWFNASNQMFESYIVGGPPSFDFPILDGWGYFVFVNEDSVLTAQGNVISNVNVLLKIGWNMIGWYHPYDTWASSLAENISGCSLVSWFNASSQMFESYIVGGPPSFDFLLSAGMGVMVWVNVASVWHGEG